MEKKATVYVWARRGKRGELRRAGVPGSAPSAGLSHYPSRRRKSRLHILRADKPLPPRRTARPGTMKESSHGFHGFYPHGRSYFRHK